MKNMLQIEQLVTPLRHDLLAVVPNGDDSCKIAQQWLWSRHGSVESLPANAMLPASLDDLAELYKGASRNDVIEAISFVTALLAPAKYYDLSETPWRALWRVVRQIPCRDQSVAHTIPTTSLNARPWPVKSKRESKRRAWLPSKPDAKHTNAVHSIRLLWEPNVVQRRDLAFISLSSTLRSILTELLTDSEKRNSSDFTRAQLFNLLSDGEDFSHWLAFMNNKAKLKKLGLIDYHAGK